MKTKLIALAFAMNAAFATSAFADNNINQINLNQDEFANFAESLTNVFSYRTSTPAEPLGWIGFDIGVSYSQVGSKYKLSNQNPEDSHKVDIVSLHASKGLPGGFDIGVQYDSLMDSSASSLTGELRYALAEGGIMFPSVSVGGFFTKTSGINALDMSSYGMDVGISKGFANLTPYANIGVVSASIDPTLDTTLSTENPTLMKWSAGVNVNFLMFDVLVGYNQIGENDSYTAKLGYRF